MTDESVTQQIDAIIASHSDWRGELLAQLRAIIQQTDPGIAEAVKWKNPHGQRVSPYGPITARSA